MWADYAVNVRYGHSGPDWEDADMADWYGSYEEAITAAENEFANPEVQEVMVTTWEDGEIEDFPLYMEREQGMITQYKNGKRFGINNAMEEMGMKYVWRMFIVSLAVYLTIRVGREWVALILLIFVLNEWS